MPAVIKTILAPSSSFSISSWASSGGQLAVSGRAPAPETLRGFKAELDFAAGGGMSESLRVGIGNDKVNAFQILRNYLLTCLPPPPPDTDDGNPRFQVHNSFFRYG